MRASYLFVTTLCALAIGCTASPATDNDVSETAEPTASSEQGIGVGIEPPPLRPNLYIKNVDDFIVGGVRHLRVEVANSDFVGAAPSTVRLGVGNCWMPENCAMLIPTPLVPGHQSVIIEQTSCYQRESVEVHATADYFNVVTERSETDNDKWVAVHCVY